MLFFRAAKKAEAKADAKADRALAALAKAHEDVAAAVAQGADLLEEFLNMMPKKDDRDE